MTSLGVRRADVFFYGLFMDEDLLRARGMTPEGAERAVIHDMALHIGERATLVPRKGTKVYGLVVSLTPDDFDRLYSEPSVLADRPQAVLAHLLSGRMIAALCYNLPQPPSEAEHNSDYAAKLRAVADKIGLPEDYIATLQ
jgi:hypothetical protein